MHYRTRRRSDRLSEREMQVLQLLAIGKQSKEIAEQFHTSPKTVETQRQALNRKLGTTTALEAVLKGIAAGWLPCPCDKAREYHGA